MGMCFNKRVFIGLGVVALGVLAVSPSLLWSLAPLLILAACPLSMVLMMRAMNRGGAGCESKPQGREQGDQVAAGGTVDPVAAVPTDAGGDAQRRELEEEVNRLRAELHLRDQDRSA